jgi:asparagine synthase (glutamine-hydrolysing)
VPRRFSDAGLFHQLMQTMVPGTTAFEGIHQVKPGHMVIVERAHGKLKIRQEKYWDMDFPLATERAEPGRGGRGILDRGGALAPDGGGPAAAGGRRSRRLLPLRRHRLLHHAGLAAATQQSPVKAFTIGFDDVDYDETAIAREMAESVGADQDVMTLQADHLYDNFVETLWHAERTIYNTLGVAKLLMSRHVNECGYRVVVTGEGSDELFAGYPSFRRDLFLHGLDTLPAADRASWQQLLSESNKLVTGAMLAQDELDDPALTGLVGFTPSCLQPWLASAAHVPGLLASERRARLEGYDPGAAIADALDGDMLEGRHPLDKAQYVWIKTMLEGQILTWGGDRVDMANSMEARPPFLDHHLAEFAAQIPPTLRIKGRTEKYVLREAMKGVLPRVLYEREKFAFMAPPAHTDPKKWAAMKALADRYLSDEAIAEAGLLDPEGVRQLFELHESEDTPASTQVQLDAVINHMIGVQVLHEHFVAADIPDRPAQGGIAGLARLTRGGRGVSAGIPTASQALARLARQGVSAAGMLPSSLQGCIHGVPLAGQPRQGHASAARPTLRPPNPPAPPRRSPDRYSSPPAGCRRGRRNRVRAPGSAPTPNRSEAPGSPRWQTRRRHRPDHGVGHLGGRRRHAASGAGVDAGPGRAQGQDHRLADARMLEQRGHPGLVVRSLGQFTQLVQVQLHVVRATDQIQHGVRRYQGRRRFTSTKRRPDRRASQSQAERLGSLRNARLP